MVKNTFPVVRKCIAGVEAPSTVCHLFFLSLRMKKIAPMLCCAFIGVAAVGCHSGVETGLNHSDRMHPEGVSGLVSLAESIANGW